MTNAVRIERLSDDEDVDITDDLSEGEGEDIKTELSGPAGQPETHATAEKQKELTVSESIHETKHRPCLSSPSEQSPPSSFNLFCAEEDRKTTSDENVVKTEPPETEAETESKLTINPIDDQSCQSRTLAHDGQLIEECHDSTGNTHQGFVCVLQGFPKKTC